MFADIHTRKGSITLEASIGLPVFIIAILTIGFCMKALYYQETATYIACNEAALAARNAYAVPVNFSLPGRIEDEIEETLEDKADAEVKRYLYNYPDFENEHLISFVLELDYNTGLPGSITRDYRTKQAFLLRCFCGKDNSILPYNFEEDDYKLVYVLHDYGEKYHTEDCTHVSIHPFETKMDKNIRKKYRACGNCRPGRVKNGTKVYVFRYGEAYHTKECGSVSRFVVQMTKGDAKLLGYDACTACGGVKYEQDKD